MEVTAPHQQLGGSSAVHWGCEEAVTQDSLSWEQKHCDWSCPGVQQGGLCCALLLAPGTEPFPKPSTRPPRLTPLTALSPWKLSYL